MNNKTKRANFAPLKSGIEKLKRNQEFLSTSDPCHYVTSNAAFNLSAVADAPTDDSQSNALNGYLDAQLFYGKFDDQGLEVLVNLCDAPIK